MLDNVIKYYKDNSGSDREPTKIDEVSTTLYYVGWSLNNGDSDSSPLWKIKRIQQVGSVWEIKYADGNYDFDNVWSDRSSLVYQ